KLNFPEFDFYFKSKENKTYIFDPIRKKWLVLNPEEWVRQHCIQFLLKTKNVPLGFIQVEKKLNVNNTEKRYDLVVFKPDHSIDLLVECKSPKVKITQKTFDQIARYNLVLKSDYLMLTNGLNHFFCKMDFEKRKYLFLPDLPNYNSSK
ncbi:MAG: type I restriction enzyme HsdR N-terminal domain-containing protein, partial [Flavobacteriaceae bacterium]